LTYDLLLSENNVNLRGWRKNERE